jgi:hypothetical protein
MSTLLSASPQTLAEFQYQCSFDVVALYTSIPVTEALMAVEYKLQGVRVIPHPLEIEDVIKLLRSVVHLTYFHYEGTIYKQIRGLPMGCAVSGIVAIIFMERIEKRALALFRQCPLFLRYVDDCYALTRSIQGAQELLSHLNNQHPSIKFELDSCRHERGTTILSLLDLTVNIKQNGEVSFDFFTKKARTSVFMHRHSALPWNQKVSTIYNERKRIEARSTNTNSENQASFTEKLHKNGYTDTDIARTHRRNDINQRRANTRPYYIDLPFWGDGVEHRIRKAFAREGIHIRPYRRSTTILDIVRPRQKEIRSCTWPTCPTKETGICFRKNCVYLLTCMPCGQRYVGSTIRALHERIREHTFSGRGSMIHGHLLTCGRGTARAQVEIVAHERDEVNTRLREAIVIKRLRPQLNTQEDSDLISHIL